jgi:hypothetical protein
MKKNEQLGDIASIIGSIIVIDMEHDWASIARKLEAAYIGGDSFNTIIIAETKFCNEQKHDEPYNRMFLRSVRGETSLNRFLVIKEKSMPT